MATDLGKVGMVMKGDYNSASTYEALDVVTYNNALYVAIQSVPAGVAPTNATYWQEAISITTNKNNLNNREVLDSSYTSANPFVTPADGFLRVYTEGPAIYAFVLGSDGNDTVNKRLSIGWGTATNSESSMCVYLRKGMKIYATTYEYGTYVIWNSLI